MSTTNTTVRIRTAEGVKRLIVKESLETFTVGDLKNQIIVEIFSQRGDFGLKLDGKRKQKSLENMNATLSEFSVVEGTMITVDYQGGIRKEAEQKEKDRNEKEKKEQHEKEDLEALERADPFYIPDKPKRIKKNKDNSDEKKEKKDRKINPKKAIMGEFDIDNTMDIKELGSYFMDQEIGKNIMNKYVHRSICIDV